MNITVLHSNTGGLIRGVQNSDCQTFFVMHHFRNQQKFKPHNPHAFLSHNNRKGKIEHFH